MSCSGVRSIEHANVLSEPINISGPGGPKASIFEREDHDPLCFDVSNFGACPTVGHGPLFQKLRLLDLPELRN